jgi:ribonuclease BN (tRNA processing enzyme)
VRLTVLGKSPAWEDAGGACSGYLLDHDGTHVLLDCGNGVFSKLRTRVRYRSVSAVAITHLHADHLLDLVPFAYALTLGPGSGDQERVPLHAPVGATGFFRNLVACWGDEELIDKAFEIREYEPGALLELGPVRIRMHAVRHFTATHAAEVFAAGAEEHRIVFGADGRASAELEDAARGADVLLAEATLPDPDPAPPEKRGHMSASEAGEVAARAGVGRLVHTHISDELDLERSRRIAADRFGGPVEVAAEGSSWCVGPESGE